MDHLSSKTYDGPPGPRVKLPSSFEGGPRAMHQPYQDAMAIVAKYGKPEYFLTFTCNPQWRDIVENLYPGQVSADARTCHVVAHVAVLWQKRGLPHCHMLLIMAADAKPRNAEHVDAAVQTYLPDPEGDNRLFGIVTKNNRRRRRLPQVQMTERGRTVAIGGETFDNQHVVPYNRFLLLLLNAHINVEINEILAFLDARKVCAPEAVRRIFLFECQFQSDSVCRLQVHFPDFQTFTFLAGEEQEASATAARKDTTLTAWFKLNMEYEKKEQNGEDLGGTTYPRTLCYSQIPEFFNFAQRTRMWKIRGRGIRQIGRMYIATPRDPERYSLQLLLLHRKKVHSFEHLRSVGSVVHLTFTETARALDLLHDDTHYEDCLCEAVTFQLPNELRALFGSMLAFCDISDPQQLSVVSRCAWRRT
ncbi:hypothetical protein ANCCAN_13290 [Ancylostoma caninum]|uniref:Helitron helicase-like domain-containing protein n=1 Tax=Ancylostoma caninum TaxID=29170 RepID=A0A368GCM8_ANCCA|nr:hypothetical protein ANCCAN_13290 [Ancylostoma caninum]